MLVTTLECCNSLPGVFKNAVEPTIRLLADIPGFYGRKPIVIMGASLGGFSLCSLTLYGR
jgi:chromate reductase